MTLVRYGTNDPNHPFVPIASDQGAVERVQQACGGGLVVDRDTHVPRLAQRRAGRDHDPGARQAPGQLAAVQCGWATQTKLAWLSVTSKWRWRRAVVRRSRSRATRLTRFSSSSEQLRKDSNAPAWEISLTPRSGSSSASKLLRAGAADRIAATQARQAPSLGEAAEHEQPRMALQ